MRKLAFLLAVIIIAILVAASCVRPSLVSLVPEETKEPVRGPIPGLGTGNGCNLGTEGGPWDSEHQFPRIITTDGDYSAADSNTSNLSAIARYDGVLWTLDWPTYRNYSNPPPILFPFAYVRYLNAGTKFIGVNHSYGIWPSYCHIDETYPNRCNIVTAYSTANGQTAPPAIPVPPSNQVTVGDGWYAKKSNGNLLTFTADTLLNWSSLDPDNSISYAQWLGVYMTTAVWPMECSGSRCWDGFYFESMGIPHPYRGPTGNFAEIDANENGITDLREGAWNKCTVDAHQMDAYNDFFDILASGGITVAGGESVMDAGLTGPNSPSYLLGHATAGFNGDFPRESWPDCSNGPHDFSGGFTTPGGNKWHYNMRQAIAWEDTGALVVNMAGEDLFGKDGDTYYQTYVSDWQQQRRLVVGSTLLINAYSTPHRDQIPTSYPCDECLVNVASGNSTTAIADGGWLGCPSNDAYSMMDGRTLRKVLVDGDLLSGQVWCRQFTNGIVCVNASETTQNVSIGTGYKYINGSANDGGDPTHNPGGTAPSTLSIHAYDAYVLIRDGAPTATPIGPTSTPTPTPTARATPTSNATSTSTPTPTITPTPTATSLPGLVLNPDNTTWKDAYLLSQSPNQNTGRWNTVGIRASTSVTVVPLPTEHPSTVKSGLIEVPFSLPATPQAAQLLYYVASASLGSGTAYVKPCKMAHEWVENEVTWNRSAAAVTWQTPGAYGATDVGPCGTPVPIATTDVGHYVAFNVGAMLESDGLSVKLEPWCTPNTQGYCNADFNLQAGRLWGANPPRLEVWVTTTATWTPTPTRTRTPTQTPTATRTQTPTATRTQTPTAHRRPRPR